MRIPTAFKLSVLILSIFALCLSACSTNSSPPLTPEIESVDLPTQTGPILQAADEITLAPTYTRPPSGQDDQTATQSPQQSEEDEANRSSTPTLAIEPSPSPTIDLNQPVITFRLHIPAIAFDRSFEGNISGRTELIDHTTERSEVRSNQNRRLIEIQSVLRDLSLETLPQNCDRCTSLAFSLPVEGIEAEGHLTDPIVLASIQHFLAQTLGAHFPPNSLVGHHRSASGYTAAHTAVLLEDGTLWRWFESDSEIPSPENVETDLLALYVEAADRFEPLEASYVTDCANFPLETVLFREQIVQVRCPELALPTPLITQYQTAAALSAPMLLDERNLEIPSTVLPMDSVIYYERIDGASLLLYEDGSVLAVSSAGEVVTTTIPTREIEPLIEPMVTGGLIPRGVTVSVQPGEPAGDLSVDSEEEFEELILIRSQLGVYEFAWTDRVGQTLVPGISVLDLLLEEKVGPVLASEDEIETPEPEE